jgi:mannose/fructose/N-acetylgalactosamine-specific phosphotransferase system component IIC
MLDKYAFGEFGLSQPIVAGTIIGAIFGNISMGIFLGAIFQLIFLGGLPVGKDIPPDAQSAGLIGCGAYFLLCQVNSPGHSLFLAVVIGLLGAIIGGAMEILIRRYNERLYWAFLRNEDHLYWCHFAGLLTAFLRSLSLFLPIFILANLLIVPSVFPQLTKELLIIIGMSVGMANGIYLFMKRANFFYFVFGGLCGLGLLVF